MIITNDLNTRQITKPESIVYRTVSYFVYFIFGILEIILAFRFVFKLLGANPSNGFVNWIYSLSAVFVAPFTGIFNTSLAKGDVVASVFEPAALVALIVYGLIALVIVTLNPVNGRQTTK
ncbi:MAG TPA: hypothetical protein VMR16_01045 [Candidatus Saccharimonadales bacterium]|nr:hypothetical protein [Candidatus Saccharimonadales bacterium]